MGTLALSSFADVTALSQIGAGTTMLDVAGYVLPDAAPGAVTRDNWIIASTLRLGHASDNQVFVRVDAGEDMTLASSVLMGPERAPVAMVAQGVVCNEIANQRLVTKAHSGG